MPGFVYIMANRRNGTLYTGSATELVRRVHEHRAGAAEGFTKRYGLMMLVWFEGPYDRIEEARLRERRIKDWRRAWKLRLIEERNPDWQDLWPLIAGV